MHGQYEARPTVTFPATEHHHPLTTGIKLKYCLVTEADVCEQLAQSRYLVTSALDPELIQGPFGHQSGLLRLYHEATSK